MRKPTRLIFRDNDTTHYKVIMNNLTLNRRIYCYDLLRCEGNDLDVDRRRDAEAKMLDDKRENTVKRGIKQTIKKRKKKIKKQSKRENHHVK